jgi:hypothetical protein
VEISRYSKKFQAMALRAIPKKFQAMALRAIPRNSKQ